MHTIHRSRSTFLGTVAFLGLVLFATVGAQEQDQPIALAPAEASWDDPSGYGSVEETRASMAPADFATDQDVSGPTGHEVSAVIGSSWDDTRGYGSSDDRIANALFGAKAHGDGSGEASRWLTAPECGTDPSQSDEPWQAPPERGVPGEPY